MYTRTYNGTNQVYTCIHMLFMSVIHPFFILMLGCIQIFIIFNGHSCVHPLSLFIGEGDCSHAWLLQPPNVNYKGLHGEI